MSSSKGTAAGINRREFLGVMGAGAAVASGALPLFAGAEPSDGAGPAPRIWVDPRIHALPKRPWRWSMCACG